MRPSHLMLAAGVLVLACGAAIHQHRTLAGLKEGTLSLERSLEDRRPTSEAATLPSGDPASDKGASVAMLKEAEEAFLAIFRSEEYSPEMEERIFHATAALDASCLADMIQKLGKHGDLPPDYMTSCVVSLFEDQPEKAVRIIEIMPGLAEFLPGAFRSWMGKDLAAAIRWFDEERGKGNPLTSDADLQRTAARALFRTDPDRGLALMLSTQPADLDDKKIDLLARESVESLIDEREHAAYLAALRRASEKSPGNPLLERIRTSYLKQLPERIRNWIFEDASALLDAELSPEQKITTARNLAVFPTLEEPEKWMNWFARIDGKFDQEHPARVFLKSWLHSDYVAVGRWLDQYPAGEAKNDLVSSYARQILKADPAEAAHHAATLPDGPQRQALAEQILLFWQAKDPAAAAAFSHESGL